MAATDQQILTAVADPLTLLRKAYPMLRASRLAPRLGGGSTPADGSRYRIAAQDTSSATSARQAGVKRARPFVTGVVVVSLVAACLLLQLSAPTTASASGASGGTPQTLSQPIKTASGATIGTFNLAMTTYVTDVVGVISSATVQLPAGTYELETCVAATQSNTFSAPPCPQVTQVTLATAGAATIPASSIVATRSLTGPANAIAGWDGVLVLQGGSWVKYAMSWQGASSYIAVPSIDPAAEATNPANGSTPQLLTQPIKTASGTTIGTFNLRMAIRDTDVVGLIPTATVQLPPGTYELESCVAATQSNTSSTTPCPQVTQVTLTTAGAATIPASSIVATRSLTGPATAIAGWDGVLVWQGGTWVKYAMSWQGASSYIAVPPVAPAVTTQLYGSDSNVIRSQPDGSLGLVDPTSQATELTNLQAQGAQVTRTNMDWAFLEPQNGYWDPTTVSEFDQYFSKAKALGLKVIVEVGSTPCWASSAPATVKNGCTSALNGASYPPANYADRTTALTWMMTRWGDAIYGVEPWNEPNVNGSSLCTNQYWGPSTYAQLLANTYQAVKAVNPSILVAAGTLSMPDTTYLDCLYNQGIQGNYDVIDVHPYQVDFATSPPSSTDPLTPFPITDPAQDAIDTGMENLHADMVAHGDTAPVWITETGFSTCQVTGSALCVTAAQQAQWLSETFKMIARWSFVTLALSYNASDTSAVTSSWNGNFGLMYNNLVAKPALSAVGQTWTCLHAGSC